MRQFTILLLCLVSFALKGQNMAPVISNLEVMTNVADQLVITYDLADAENDDVEITLRVSDNDGQTFGINTSSATGDIGYPISSGSSKEITWDYLGEISEMGNYQIKVVADDLQALDIQSIVDQVDSNRLRSNLEQIVGIRHLVANPSHLRDVKDMIVDRFNDHALQVETNDFKYGNYTAENFVGLKSGLNDEIETYYVTGHYDTVDDSPGADDNGSAIAGMMEVLRVLAPYNFKKSIKFVAFDLEEFGLVGSSYYVNTYGLPDYENVAGVFNFEMIGYFDDAANSQTLPTGFNQLYPNVYNEIRKDSFRGNFITNVGIYNHPDLNLAYENAASKYVPDLKVISVLAPEQWQAFTPDLARSDHAPFWSKELPALMLTDASNFRNPYYHTPNDTVGTLNFTFMSHVVKATVGALAELAENSNSTSEVVEIELLTSNSDLASCHPQIFPNPISNILKLNLSDCNLDNASVRIYSIHGKEMYAEELESDQVAIEIPTQHFPSGTYLLSIQSDGESIERKVSVVR